MYKTGDLIPSFSIRSIGNSCFAFDSAAGRYNVLSFVHSSTVPGVAGFLEQVRSDERFFDDRFASMFIASNDPDDEAQARLDTRLPGVRILWDERYALARMFGCLRDRQDTGEQIALSTWIIDPAMRVVSVIPIEDFATHFDRICDVLATLPAPAERPELAAPVLAIANVIEPALCRELIETAERQGFHESAYLTREVRGGQVIAVVNPFHKRRLDSGIRDERLRAILQARITRHILPEVERAFQFRATRMERYIVSRYDAATEAFVAPHRENGCLGTAHRRFAVSINLGGEDHEGGELRFPEFGNRIYRVPAGGALVYSAALLNEVLPVTSGTRYALLPFLFDEAAAHERSANARYLLDEEQPRTRPAAVPAPEVAAAPSRRKAKEAAKPRATTRKQAPSRRKKAGKAA